jgi:hypothetical protein
MDNVDHPHKFNSLVAAQQLVLTRQLRDIGLLRMHKPVTWSQFVLGPYIFIASRVRIIEGWIIEVRIIEVGLYLVCVLLGTAIPTSFPLFNDFYACYSFYCSNSSMLRT